MNRNILVGNFMSINFVQSHFVKVKTLNQDHFCAPAHPRLLAQGNLVRLLPNCPNIAMKSKIGIDRIIWEIL